MTNWIDANEDLPETGREVLLYMPKHLGFVVGYREIYHSSESWNLGGYHSMGDIVDVEFNFDLNVKLDAVTYWMPIPELPDKPSA